MKLRGGYSVPLSGRPAGEIEPLPEPDALHLPLTSRRFRFADVRVKDGQQVRQGEVLATDGERYGVPLLAGRAGTVRLGENCIVLTDLAEEDEGPYRPDELGPHADDHGPAAGRRRKLVDLGAWQFFTDAHSGSLPDPTAEPRAILVTTMSLEPFSARGDVQLARLLAAFTRGLEHLQSLLEYQPIYLIVPEAQGELAEKVHATLRGHAYLKVVRVPLKYPYDHPALLARHLGLRRGDEGSVWALRTEGVLAVDRAMTHSLPSTVRIVAVGGPGLARPTHVKAVAGYPIEKILSACGAEQNVRVLIGGALTGTTWSAEQVGLDAECTALTAVPDEAPRVLLGWGRPGWDEQSFSPYYVSRLRKAFTERLGTAVRGERRACVSCGLCEQACPAGIWPHLIHKYLYRDGLEEAEAAGIDLCVECGLCAYVCPSKIELLQQFRDAKKAIAELREEEMAEAAAEGDEAREVTT